MNLKTAIRSVLAYELLKPIRLLFAGEITRAMCKIENQYLVLTETDYNLVNADGTIAKRISYSDYLHR